MDGPVDDTNDEIVPSNCDELMAKGNGDNQ